MKLLLWLFLTKQQIFPKISCFYQPNHQIWFNVVNIICTAVETEAASPGLEVPPKHPGSATPHRFSCSVNNRCSRFRAVDLWTSWHQAVPQSHCTDTVQPPTALKSALCLPLSGRTCWRMIFLSRARLPLQQLSVLLSVLVFQAWQPALLWFPFLVALEEVVVGRTFLWVLQEAQIPVGPVQENMS